jgi:hypothetical protein
MTTQFPLTLEDPWMNVETLLLRERLTETHLERTHAEAFTFLCCAKRLRLPRDIAKLIAKEYLFARPPDPFWYQYSTWTSLETKKELVFPHLRFVIVALGIFISVVLAQLDFNPSCSFLVLILCWCICMFVDYEWIFQKFAKSEKQRFTFLRK